jgi:secreted effector protein SseB
MSHIDTVRVNTAQSTAVADKNDVQKNDYLMAMKNHSIMGDAMVTMEEMMLMFTELAAKKFEQSALANIATADGTATLDQDILDYIKDNNILVNNKPIGDFINGASKPKEAGKFGTMDQTKPVNGAAGDNADNVAGTLPTVPNEGTGAINLDKKALKSIQSTLESASTRATDFVQQDQLKLQQLMQSFNTAVAMANAVQSMNAESTKAIAQSIR